MCSWVILNRIIRVLEGMHFATLEQIRIARFNFYTLLYSAQSARGPREAVDWGQVIPLL